MSLQLSHLKKWRLTCGNLQICGQHTWENRRQAVGAALIQNLLQYHKACHFFAQFVTAISPRGLFSLPMSPHNIGVLNTVQTALQNATSDEKHPIIMILFLGILNLTLLSIYHLLLRGMLDFGTYYRKEAIYKAESTPYLRFKYQSIKCKFPIDFTTHAFLSIEK